MDTTLIGPPHMAGVRASVYCRASLSRRAVLCCLRVHGRAPLVCAGGHMVAVLRVHKVQQPVAKEAHQPGHGGGHQQGTAQRVRVLAHLAGGHGVRGVGALVVEAPLRQQPHERRDHRGDAALQAAVVCVDHAAQVLRDDIRKDGVVAAGGAPADEQPHRPQRHEVRREGDARGGGQPLEQRRDHGEPRRHAGLRDQDAAVVG
mmetsp:Transcript_33059/g.84469  ORF Transcript_33059/g.84469 Transcript_33059/m.84469 type:complete len:203 (+) Transcript_33059:202-810(+)